MDLLQITGTQYILETFFSVAFWVGDGCTKVFEEISRVVFTSPEPKNKRGLPLKPRSKKEEVWLSPPGSENVVLSKEEEAMIERFSYTCRVVFGGVAIETDNETETLKTNDH